MPDEPPATLRFVVLRHEGIPQPHFDLMFETEPGGGLTTYRSPVWPLEDHAQLVQLGEHRRAYLDYEGPLSGSRGRVHRVASGTFRWLSRGATLTEVRLLEAGTTWQIRSTPGDNRATALSA